MKIFLKIYCCSVFCTCRVENGKFASMIDFYKMYQIVKNVQFQYFGNVSFGVFHRYLTINVKFYTE